MPGRVAHLALAVGLICIGVTRAEETASGTSISPVRPPGEGGDRGEVHVGAGFGFSPFMEEDLVSDLPPRKFHEAPAPVPAYLRDAYGSAEPP